MVDVQPPFYNSNSNDININPVVKTRGQIPVMDKALGIHPAGSTDVQSHASVSQGNPTSANTITQGVPRREAQIPLNMSNFPPQILAQGTMWPNGGNFGLTPGKPWRQQDR